MAFKDEQALSNVTRSNLLIIEMSFANIFTKVFKNNKKNLLNLILGVFQRLSIKIKASKEINGNPGGRGGLWTWKSGQEGGSSGPGNPGGRGGQKIMPSVGGVDFFWNNPFPVPMHNASHIQA